MASKIERFESNLLTVLAKERELRKVGYQEAKLLSEHQLECGEYLVKVPSPEDPAAIQSWDNVTLFWRTT